MGLINYEDLQDGTSVTANIFNERFGQIVSVINGGLDTNNFANDGIPAAALASDVFEKIYPVGSIYINATNSTNPATLLGFGTWVAFGAGRVPVGYNGADTDFNAAEKVGGHKQPQAHTHTATTNTTGSHSHAMGRSVAYSASSTIGLTNEPYKTNDYTGGNFNTDASGNHSHTLTTASSGTGNAGNLQPFITVYMWKRTA